MSDFRFNFLEKNALACNRLLFFCDIGFIKNSIDLEFNFIFLWGFLCIKHLKKTADLYSKNDNLRYFISEWFENISYFWYSNNGFGKEKKTLFSKQWSFDHFIIWWTNIKCIIFVFMKILSLKWSKIVISQPFTMPHFLLTFKAQILPRFVI